MDLFKRDDDSLNYVSQIILLEDIMIQLALLIQNVENPTQLPLLLVGFTLAHGHTRLVM